MRFFQTILVIGLIACCTPAAMAASHPPKIEWRTLETSHFRIHFNARHEAVAQRLGGMVEPIHDALTRDLRWAPDEKTHVVLIDYIDLSNGSATPVPYNAIEIYLTGPGPNSALGDYDDWLRLVFTHEYVHILHLDQASGPAKIVRDLLGRNFLAAVNGIPVPIAPFPNLLIPPWMIEGFATLDESRHTTAGRGHSAYAAMVLRMAALDKKFFPLDKGSGEEGEWPGGAFRYLYGEAFLEYLTSKYGIDAVNKMYRINSLGVTPFLIELPAYLSFDATLQTEWRRWELRLTEESKALRKNLTHQGLTQQELLSEGGWETRYPRLSPDRTTLYYTVSNNYSFPHVMAYDMPEGRHRKLFERNLNLGPAVPDSANRYLYFTQLEAHEKFSLLADAYRYSITEGTTERLTHGERLLSLDLSPDGRHVAAVRNDVSGQSLVLYALDGKKLVRQRVLAGGENRIFDTPRFSPTGDKIAYSGWTEGGYTDVYEIDLEGHERRLTFDRYVEIAPSYSGDGTAIVFSSDRTGIYNLFEIAATATTEATPTQLTNVIGGLFESDSLDSNNIIAASYTGEGFFVAKVKIDRSSNLEQTWMPDRPAYHSQPAPGAIGMQSKPYSPASSIWPRSWRPTLNLTTYPGGPIWSDTFEAGLSVQGADVLRKHQYGIDVYYERVLHSPGFAANYAYDGFTPTLHLFADHIPREGSLVAIGNDRTPEISGVGSTGAGMAVQLPFPGIRSRQDVVLAYSFTHDREFGELQHPGQRIWRNRGTAVAEWTYNSTRAYEITVGPQDGSLFGIAGHLIAPELGASYSNVLLLGDARHYLSLPYQQTVAAQAQAGIAQMSESPGPFFLGGRQPRTSPTDIGLLPLRGIALGEQEGNKTAKASLEYRFPLALIKRGIPIWGTFPFMIDQLQGSLFTEAGTAWRTKPDWRASAGAEVTTAFTFGYYYSYALGAGIAVPLLSDDPVQIYLVSWLVNF